MKLHFKVLQISVNLPLQSTQVFFLLSDKSQPNSSPNISNYKPTNQYHLIPQITEITLPVTQFTIELQNPEEHKVFNLQVLAISNSTSKFISLGQVQIDLRTLETLGFQNANRQILKRPLLGMQNQKGSLSFEVYKFQLEFQSSHLNQKSSESLDKQETCSSDSYEANLKDLNKTAIVDDSEDFSPKFKHSLENYHRNVDYTQKIILEEIDLEDEQDEQFYERKSALSKKNHQIALNRAKTQIDSLRVRLIEERFKVQLYLHSLQETDFFLMKMEEKMKLFAE